MFDAILYFYQSKGIFKPPTNIDEDVVNTELDFYKISMDKIFGTVEEASKKTYIPFTMKQKVRHLTIMHNVILGSIIFYMEF